MNMFVTIGGREFPWEYEEPPKSGTLVHIQGFGPFTIGDWWSSEATYSRQTYHLVSDGRGSDALESSPEKPSAEPAGGLFY
jgi:hypothetical protein